MATGASPRPISSRRVENGKAGTAHGSLPSVGRVFRPAALHRPPEGLRHRRRPHFAFLAVFFGLMSPLCIMLRYAESFCFRGRSTRPRRRLDS